MATSKTTGSCDKMFGPLTFEDSKYDLEPIDIETKCLLCEDSFNVRLRIDIFLSHIFDVHKCVIEDVQNIRNLPEYILYWRDRLKSSDLEHIIPAVKVDSTGNQYFLFSSLLKEDEKLRHKLTLDYVMKVHEYERTDKSFTRQCLFCKLQYEGSRQGYLDHLSEQHNLQLGNPQNLVFIDDLIKHIDQKLQTLTCLYCEGVFPERNILKEHMRKKLHKRINSSNSEYDKYYIVNYLEVGKSWRAIEREDDRYALPRGGKENSDEEYLDWNEKEDQITCLFCPFKERNINLLCLHMDAEHNFDFVVSTENLDFYQKVKLVNYIRKMVHSKRCPYCEEYCETSEDLQGHMQQMQHCKMPEVKMFDQPEFYFPTYENDSFLYLIDYEKQDTVTCLFCPRKETNINVLSRHMDAEHNFDFVVSTHNLNFYQRVVLVKHIRKMILNKTCPYCEKNCESLAVLEDHMKEMEHCKAPEENVFDMPEFNYPINEDDSFLYSMDDLEGVKE